MNVETETYRPLITIPTASYNIELSEIENLISELSEPPPPPTTESLDDLFEEMVPLITHLQKEFKTMAPAQRQKIRDAVLMFTVSEESEYISHTEQETTPMDSEIQYQAKNADNYINSVLSDVPEAFTLNASSTLSTESTTIKPLRAEDFNSDANFVSEVLSTAGPEEKIITLSAGGTKATTAKSFSFLIKEKEPNLLTTSEVNEDEEITEVPDDVLKHVMDNLHNKELEIDNQAIKEAIDKDNAKEEEKKKGNSDLNDIAEQLQSPSIIPDNSENKSTAVDDLATEIDLEEPLKETEKPKVKKLLQKERYKNIKKTKEATTKKNEGRASMELIKKIAPAAEIADFTENYTVVKLSTIEDDEDDGGYAPVIQSDAEQILEYIPRYKRNAVSENLQVQPKSNKDTYEQSHPSEIGNSFIKTLNIIKSVNYNMMRLKQRKNQNKPSLLSEKLLAANVMRAGSAKSLEDAGNAKAIRKIVVSNRNPKEAGNSTKKKEFKAVSLPYSFILDMKNVNSFTLESESSTCTSESYQDFMKQLAKIDNVRISSTTSPPATSEPLACFLLDQKMSELAGFNAENFSSTINVPIDREIDNIDAHFCESLTDMESSASNFETTITKPNILNQNIYSNYDSKMNIDLDTIDDIKSNNLDPICDPAGLNMPEDINADPYFNPLVQPDLGIEQHNSGYSKFCSNFPKFDVDMGDDGGSERIDSYCNSFLDPLTEMGGMDSEFDKIIDEDLIDQCFTDISSKMTTAATGMPKEVCTKLMKSSDGNSERNLKIEQMSDDLSHLLKIGQAVESTTKNIHLDFNDLRMHEGFDILDEMTTPRLHNFSPENSKSNLNVDAEFDTALLNHEVVNLSQDEITEGKLFGQNFENAKTDMNLKLKVDLAQNKKVCHSSMKLNEDASKLNDDLEVNSNLISTENRKFFKAPAKLLPKTQLKEEIVTEQLDNLSPMSNVKLKQDALDVLYKITTVNSVFNANEKSNSWSFKTPNAVCSRINSNLELPFDDDDYMFQTSMKPEVATLLEEIGTIYSNFNSKLIETRTQSDSDSTEHFLITDLEPLATASIKPKLFNESFKNSKAINNDLKVKSQREASTKKALATNLITSGNLGLTEDKIIPATTEINYRSAEIPEIEQVMNEISEINTNYFETNILGEGDMLEGSTSTKPETCKQAQNLNDIRTIHDCIKQRRSDNIKMSTNPQKYLVDHSKFKPLSQQKKFKTRSYLLPRQKPLEALNENSFPVNLNSNSKSLANYSKQKSGNSNFNLMPRNRKIINRSNTPLFTFLPHPLLLPVRMQKNHPQAIVTIDNRKIGDNYNTNYCKLYVQSPNIATSNLETREFSRGVNKKNKILDLRNQESKMETNPGMIYIPVIFNDAKIYQDKSRGFFNFPKAGIKLPSYKIQNKITVDHNNLQIERPTINNLMENQKPYYIISVPNESNNQNNLEEVHNKNIYKSQKTDYKFRIKDSKKGKLIASYIFPPIKSPSKEEKDPINDFIKNDVQEASRETTSYRSPAKGLSIYAISNKDKVIVASYVHPPSIKTTTAISTGNKYLNNKKTSVKTLKICSQTNMAKKFKTENKPPIIGGYRINAGKKNKLITAYFKSPKKFKIKNLKEQPKFSFKCCKHLLPNEHERGGIKESKPSDKETKNSLIASCLKILRILKNESMEKNNGDSDDLEKNSENNVLEVSTEKSNNSVSNNNTISTSPSVIHNFIIYNPIKGTVITSLIKPPYKINISNVDSVQVEKIHTTTMNNEDITLPRTVSSAKSICTPKTICNHSATLSIRNSTKKTPIFNFRIGNKKNNITIGSIISPLRTSKGKEDSTTKKKIEEENQVQMTTTFKTPFFNYRIRNKQKNVLITAFIRPPGIKAMKQLKEKNNNNATNVPYPKLKKNPQPGTMFTSLIIPPQLQSKENFSFLNMDLDAMNKSSHKSDDDGYLAKVSSSKLSNKPDLSNINFKDNLKLNSILVSTKKNRASHSIDKNHLKKENVDENTFSNSELNIKLKPAKLQKHTAVFHKPIKEYRKRLSFQPKKRKRLGSTTISSPWKLTGLKEINPNLKKINNLDFSHNTVGLKNYYSNSNLDNKFKSNNPAHNTVGLKKTISNFKLGDKSKINNVDITHKTIAIIKPFSRSNLISKSKINNANRAYKSLELKKQNSISKLKINFNNPNMASKITERNEKRFNSNIDRTKINNPGITYKTIALTKSSSNFNLGDKLKTNSLDISHGIVGLKKTFSNCNLNSQLKMNNPVLPNRNVQLKQHFFNPNLGSKSALKKVSNSIQTDAMFPNSQYKQKMKELKKLTAVKLKLNPSPLIHGRSNRKQDFDFNPTWNSKTIKAFRSMGKPRRLKSEKDLTKVSASKQLASYFFQNEVTNNQKIENVNNKNNLDSIKGPKTGRKKRSIDYSELLPNSQKKLNINSDFYQVSEKEKFLQNTNNELNDTKKYYAQKIPKDQEFNCSKFIDNPNQITTSDNQFGSLTTNSFDLVTNSFEATLTSNLNSKITIPNCKIETRKLRIDNLALSQQSLEEKGSPIRTTVERSKLKHSSSLQRKKREITSTMKNLKNELVEPITPLIETEASVDIKSAEFITAVSKSNLLPEKENKNEESLSDESEEANTDKEQEVGNVLPQFEHIDTSNNIQTEEEEISTKALSTKHYQTYSTTTDICKLVKEVKKSRVTTSTVAYDSEWEEEELSEETKSTEHILLHPTTTTDICTFVKDLKNTNKTTTTVPDEDYVEQEETVTEITTVSQIHVKSQDFTEVHTLLPENEATILLHSAGASNLEKSEIIMFNTSEEATTKTSTAHKAANLLNLTYSEIKAISEVKTILEESTMATTDLFQFTDEDEMGEKTTLKHDSTSNNKSLIECNFLGLRRTTIEPLFHEEKFTVFKSPLQELQSNKNNLAKGEYNGATTKLNLTPETEDESECMPLQLSPARIIMGNFGRNIDSLTKFPTILYEHNDKENASNLTNNDMKNFSLLNVNDASNSLIGEGEFKNINLGNILKAQQLLSKVFNIIRQKQRSLFEAKRVMEKLILIPPNALKKINNHAIVRPSINSETGNELQTALLLKAINFINQKRREVTQAKQLAFKLIKTIEQKSDNRFLEKYIANSKRWFPKRNTQNRVDFVRTLLNILKTIKTDQENIFQVIEGDSKVAIANPKLNAYKKLIPISNCNNSIKINNQLKTEIINDLKMKLMSYVKKREHELKSVENYAAKIQAILDQSYNHQSFKKHPKFIKKTEALKRHLPKLIANLNDKKEEISKIKKRACIFLDFLNRELSRKVKLNENKIDLQKNKTTKNGKHSNHSENLIVYTVYKPIGKNSHKVLINRKQFLEEETRRLDAHFYRFILSRLLSEIVGRIVDSPNLYTPNKEVLNKNLKNVEDLCHFIIEKLRNTTYDNLESTTNASVIKHSSSTYTTSCSLPITTSIIKHSNSTYTTRCALPNITSMCNETNTKRKKNNRLVTDQKGTISKPNQLLNTSDSVGTIGLIFINVGNNSQKVKTEKPVYDLSEDLSVTKKKHNPVTHKIMGQVLDLSEYDAEVTTEIENQVKDVDYYMKDYFEEESWIGSSTWRPNRVKRESLLEKLKKLGRNRKKNHKTTPRICTQSLTNKIPFHFDEVRYKNVENITAVSINTTPYLPFIKKKLFGFLTTTTASTNSKTTANLDVSGEPEYAKIFDKDWQDLFIDANYQHLTSSEKHIPYYKIEKTHNSLGINTTKGLVMGKSGKKDSNKVSAKTSLIKEKGAIANNKSEYKTVKGVLTEPNLERAFFTYEQQTKQIPSYQFEETKNVLTIESTTKNIIDELADKYISVVLHEMTTEMVSEYRYTTASYSTNKKLYSAANSTVEQPKNEILKLSPTTNNNSEWTELEKEITALVNSELKSNYTKSETEGKSNSNDQFEDLEQVLAENLKENEMQLTETRTKQQKKLHSKKDREEQILENLIHKQTSLIESTSKKSKSVKVENLSKQTDFANICKTTTESLQNHLESTTKSTYQEYGIDNSRESWISTTENEVDLILGTAKSFLTGNILEQIESEFTTPFDEMLTLETTDETVSKYKILPKTSSIKTIEELEEEKESNPDVTLMPPPIFHPSTNEAILFSSTFSHPTSSGVTQSHNIDNSTLHELEINLEDYTSESEINRTTSFENLNDLSEIYLGDLNESITSDTAPQRFSTTSLGLGSITSQNNIYSHTELIENIESIAENIPKTTTNNAADHSIEYTMQPITETAMQPVTSETTKSFFAITQKEDVLESINNMAEITEESEQDEEEVTLRTEPTCEICENIKSEEIAETETNLEQQGFLPTFPHIAYTTVREEEITTIAAISPFRDMLNEIHTFTEPIEKEVGEEQGTTTEAFEEVLTSTKEVMTFSTASENGIDKPLHFTTAFNDVKIITGGLEEILSMIPHTETAFTYDTITTENNKIKDEELDRNNLLNQLSMSENKIENLKSTTTYLGKNINGPTLNTILEEDITSGYNPSNQISPEKTERDDFETGNFEGKEYSSSNTFSHIIVTTENLKRETHMSLEEKAETTETGEFLDVRKSTKSTQTPLEKVYNIEGDLNVGPNTEINSEKTNHGMEFRGPVIPKENGEEKVVKAFVSELSTVHESSTAEIMSEATYYINPVTIKEEENETEEKLRKIEKEELVTEETETDKTTISEEDILPNAKSTKKFKSNIFHVTTALMLLLSTANGRKTAGITTPPPVHVDLPLLTSSRDIKTTEKTSVTQMIVLFLNEANAETANKLNGTRWSFNPSGKDLIPYSGEFATALPISPHDLQSYSFSPDKLNLPSNIKFGGCDENDFENQNDCVCSIDTLLYSLVVNIVKGDSLAPPIKCDSFFKVDNGLIIDDNVVAEVRRRRSYLFGVYDAAIKKREIPNIDEGFFNAEFKIRNSDKHIYTLVSSKITIPCATTEETTEFNHFTKFVWKFNDETEITDGIGDDGSLEIDDVLPQYTGNYSCRAFSQISELEGSVDTGKVYYHQLIVVSPPIYKFRTNVKYNLKNSCTLIDADILYNYLPTMFRELICGFNQKVCSVEIQRPKCINQEDEHLLNMTFIVTMAHLPHLIPVDNNICKINCQMNITSKLASIVSKNIEMLEKLPVFSLLRIKKEVFVPAKVLVNAQKTLKSSAPILVIICPPGFGVEKKHPGLCVACPKDTYSTGNESYCRLCKPGTYQLFAGQSECIKCTSPLEHVTCLRALYSNTEQFKINVAIAFSVVILFLALLICSVARSNSHTRNNSMSNHIQYRYPAEDIEKGVAEPLIQENRNKAPSLPPRDFH